MFRGDSRTTGASKAGMGVNQAQALEYFEQFINAATLKNILGYFRTMCELLHLKPTYYPLFYPKLKAMLNSWKAKAIWKKLDARAGHKCYAKGKLGEKTRVLIIGGGPCGLRSAIEAQLLGCKVVVVEKRDRLSRNNVLHLWPFVIEDLRALGAKKFFGKFCAGAIDHISIRQLQCILYKIALILGVEIHTEVSFENLIEPNQDEKIGWHAQVKPQNHPVSQYEFDVIIGADGKRNTLQGFKRKEFRGKLAIAITANFINKRTEAEARVEEISGVAFIFNQKFFKDLYQETGIDLENIVYYKDDTHYFVMTAKKPSLIEKGVILQDLADTERLLALENVNREALLNYAKEAADFSTNYQMPDVEFAVNHYGQADVAMFDFTSMYAAENASKVVERSGYQLLVILVGDSLLEPFWPTGSGCARGFLSSLDAAWAIRSWSLAKASPLEVLAERESIYRLLAQTTPDNLNKDWKSYTLDPSTRYPNLNRSTVTPHQLVSLYDTDDIQNIEKMGRNLLNASTVSRKRRRDIVDSEILIDWVKHQIKNHPDLEVTDLTSIFRSGKILCAIIHHYRPDLINYANLEHNEPSANNQLAVDVLEKDIGIPPIMTGQEISNTQDNVALTAYLTQIYDVFRTEIPHVKHPKLTNVWNISEPKSSKPVEEIISVYKNNFLKRNENNIEPYEDNTEGRIISNLSICFAQNITRTSSSESLLMLYPYFLSATPSECLEFESKEERKNDDSISNSSPRTETNVDETNERNKDPSLQIVSKKDANQEMPMVVDMQQSMVLQVSKTKGFCHLGRFNFKMRSKLFRKHCFEEMPMAKSSKKKDSLFSDSSKNSLWIKISKTNQEADHAINFQSSRNILTIFAKTPLFPTLFDARQLNDIHNVNEKRQISKNLHIKFLSNAIMCDAEDNESVGPEQVFSRVSNWIESNDFGEEDTESTEVLISKSDPIETNIEEGFSDITSITKCLEMKNMGRAKRLIVAKSQFTKRSQEEQSNNKDGVTSGGDNKKVKKGGEPSQESMFQVGEKVERQDAPFSVIMEGHESDLPDSKHTTTSFKTLLKDPTTILTTNVTARTSGKHKRHGEGISINKNINIDRKTRKRKTFDKTGNVVLKAFMRGVIESSIVAFTLFVMDVFINSEHHGYETSGFRYMLNRFLPL